MTILAAVLLPNMTCNKNFVKMAQSSSLTVSPSPIIIKNDSLYCEMTLEVFRSRASKRRTHEISFILISGKEHQKIGSVTVPPIESRKDPFARLKQPIKVLVNISIDSMANIEAKSTWTNYKNGSFSESPQIGIAEVFADSAAYQAHFEFIKKNQKDADY